MTRRAERRRRTRITEKRRLARWFRKTGSDDAPLGRFEKSNPALRVDRRCGNHGTCSWCAENRQHKHRRRMAPDEEGGR